MSVSWSPSDTESMLASALLKIRSDSIGGRSDGRPASDASPVASKPVVLAPKPEQATRIATKMKESIPPKESTSPKKPRMLWTPIGTMDQALPLTALQATYAGLSRSPIAVGFLQNCFLNTTPPSSPPDAKDPEVRREKVEAALKSKPQRGRKRENLNEQERLELTRTRNREHAKSTRIRKKARNQELLDKEQKLDAMVYCEELEERRRQTVIDFVAARERMLHACVRYVPDELCGLIEDPTSFSFEYTGGDVSPETPGFDSLVEFDATLTSRLIGRFGTDARSLLYCRLVGGADSVGLARDSSGLAMVELGLATESSETSLLKGVVSVRFAEHSNKLKAVVWSTTVDSFDSAQLEKLRAQSSYPSVISLDRTSPAADAGPGMDI